MFYEKECISSLRSVIGCESLVPEILTLWYTNLEDSNDSSIFSVKGYPLLIERISFLICMVLQFMLRRHLLLHRTYPEKTLSIHIYVFFMYIIHCLTSFYHYRSPCSYLGTVFDAICSNIEDFNEPLC